MLVKDLIEELKKHPVDAEVLIRAGFSDFDVEPINDVRMQTVPWKEDPDGPALSESDCVILDAEF